MKKTLIVIMALAVALSAFSSGCGKKNKREKLAPELAAEAMEAFESERYQSSIETFNKLRDWYPFDKLATLAEFKIAEAHFKMEEYEEAIVAYEEFVKLHPRNESIAYVLNQIALCYYNRIDTVDRDQNTARSAIEAFSKLTRQFPDSTYARESEEKKTVCLKSLAGHEIYVGRFYYKSKHYKGAKARFQTVLSQYPGLGFDKEAGEFMALCDEKLAKEGTDKSGRHDEMIIMPE
jgi:outer membrane protein assembly factor BamD